ncbi:MAG: hypothetical protein U1F77_04630 [Kiritimatiellia bacterium]
MRVTLRSDTPVIGVVVDLDKQACTAPEGIYFATPLNLPAGWRCHFDTAGLPVELDAEQLPGASRGWFTAESFVSLHGGGGGRRSSAPTPPWRWPADSISVPRPTPSRAMSTRCCWPGRSTTTGTPISRSRSRGPSACATGC